MARIDLDPTTWKILDDLLSEALELPPDARPAFLDELPPHAHHVRDRLAALLEHADEERPDQRFDTLPRIGPDELRSTLHEAGDVVGPYRLLRLIAEGGMGEVWLAHRADGIVKRPVALKLPHKTSHVGFAERLIREREILASLTHPHIARLYDAGLAADGQPYLALEFVEGRPIDVYADESDIDVRRRLKLFVDLASAVSHAHQHLVIHRDIKPSNILVTDDGRVQLLDFGIATLVEKGRTAQSELTRESGQALTVAYASPEQIRGESLTVASDVYSLGVVLFELLTGTRAYRPTRDSVGALEEAVLRDDAPRPSEVAPAARKRTLRGDLDAIIGHAMSKSPEARYPTVDAFRADVLRFLEGRPVEAERMGTLYRAKKFVGRNRAGVLAATLTLFAILSGTAASVWQARVATVERDRAEEVKRFIVSMFEDVNVQTGDGKPLPAVDLLRQARARVDRTLTHPEVRIELLRLVAKGLLSFHDRTEAEVVARQAAEEAANVFGAGHVETLRLNLLHAWALSTAGKRDELDVLLDDLEPRLTLHPDRRASDVIQLYRIRSRSAFQKGDFKTAVRFGEAATAVKKVDGDDEVERLLATIQLVEAYSFAGRHADALATIEQAKTAAVRLFADTPAHPYRIFVRSTHASALGRAGQLDAAIRELLAVAQQREAIFGSDALAIGIAYNNVVGLQLDAGRVVDALQSSERAHRTLVAGGDPGSYAVVAAQNSRGKALLAARRGAEAAEILRVVSDAAATIFGPKHKNTIRTRATAALALAYAGQLDEALRQGDRILEALPEDAVSRGAIYATVGRIHRLARRDASALIYFEKAVQLLPSDERSKTTRAGAATMLGLALLDAGDVERSAVLLDDAVFRYREVRSAIAPDHADALSGLGRIRLVQGKPDQALVLLAEADGFWRSFAPDSAWAADARRALDDARVRARGH